MNWIGETWKEISVLTKKVLKVKDVFLAILFLGNIIGGIERYYHGKSVTQKIAEISHINDILQRRADSCTAELINHKYGD